MIPLGPMERHGKCAAGVQAMTEIKAATPINGDVGLVSAGLAVNASAA